MGDCTLFHAAVAPRELHYAYFFNDRRFRQRERQGYRQGRQPVAFPGAIAGFVAQAVFTGLIELCTGWAD